MHTLSYALVACPALVAAYGLLLWTLRLLAQGGYDSWSHYVRVAFITQILLSYFQLFVWAKGRFAISPPLRMSFAERPAAGGTDKFGMPVAEEAVKLCSLMIVMFMGGNARNYSVSYAYTVAGVYGFNVLVANVVKFCPLHYKQRFQKFLLNYSVYKSHTEQQPAKRASFSSLGNSSLLASASTLAVPEEVCKPVFNLNSFEKAIPLAHSKLMQTMNLSLVSYNDSIERLYSVSPKNSLHRQLGQNYGKNDAISAKFSEAFESSILVDLEAQSFHTADTHFGGGGGGNFKYELPDGTKLKFGGGAGFDYSHGSNPGSERGSRDDSSDSVKSADYKFNLKLYKSSPELGASLASFSTRETHSNPYGLSDETSIEESRSRLLQLVSWFRWMLPIAHKDDQPARVSPKALRHIIRKKMSTYTMNSETTLLKSCPRRLYGTIEISSQLAASRPVENVHEYYKFAKFANLFFDVWSPRLLDFYKGVDPAFSHFGTLLTDLPVFYFTIYSLSICLWQFSSTLILAYPFVDSCPTVATYLGIVALLIVVRFFCINYLHNQATCSYRVSLVVELVVNCVLFASVFSHYYHGL